MNKVNNLLVVLFLIMFIFCFTNVSLAATIYLKSGEKIQSKIVEETKHYIIVDKKTGENYITVTIGKDEISSIKRESVRDQNKIENLSIFKVKDVKGKVKSQNNAAAKKVNNFKATYVKKEKGVNIPIVIEKAKIIYVKGKGFKETFNQPVREVVYTTKNKFLSKNFTTNVTTKIRLNDVREKLKEDNVKKEKWVAFDIWESESFLKPFNYNPIFGFRVVKKSLQKLDGEEVYKFVLKREERAPETKEIKKSVANLWIDKQFGIIRKLIIREGKNTDFYLKLKNLKVNKDLNNVNFDFSIPKNMKLIDETSIVLSEIESL